MKQASSHSHKAFADFHQITFKRRASNQSHPSPGRIPSMHHAELYKSSCLSSHIRVDVFHCVCFGFRSSVWGDRKWAAVQRQLCDLGAQCLPRDGAPRLRAALSRHGAPRVRRSRSAGNISGPGSAPAARGFHRSAHSSFCPFPCKLTIPETNLMTPWIGNVSRTFWEF